MERKRITFASIRKCRACHVRSQLFSDFTNSKPKRKQVRDDHHSQNLSLDRRSPAAARCGGGGYGYWFLTHSDELVRGILLEKLQAAAPDWNAKIYDVHFDWWGRVRIYDLTLQNPESRDPALTLPETIVILDRARLADEQVIVQELRLLRPELHLIRDRSGGWNIEGIKPKKQESQPEIFVQHGSVTIQVTNVDGSLSPPLVLHDIDLEMTPTGKRQYQIKTLFQLARAGKAEIDGEIDLTAKTWEMNGALENLKLGPELMRELAAFFPDKVRQWEQKADEFMASRNIALPAMPVADVAGGSSVPARSNFVDRISQTVNLTATTDVTFQLQQWKAEAPLQFGAKFLVENGRLESELLPFNLHDIGGELFVNNSQLIVRGLSARNGPTQLRTDGKWTFQELNRPVKFGISVIDLQVDQRLRSKLPATWKKYYDDMQPSGAIDLLATVSHDSVGGWDYRSDIKIKHGSAKHVKFPYRVDQIYGTVEQKGPKIIADLRGMAGEREFTLTANVSNPGPLAESTVDIHVEQLPIDNKLIAACAPPARMTIELLELRGFLDADVRLYRPPGPGHKHRPQLKGRLLNCTATYEHFPYELKNLNGVLEWDSVNWTFDDMSAKHGAAVVKGNGNFKKRGDIGRLEMNLFATDAKFDDRELYQALPPAMQSLSDEFNLQGRFDLDSHISWSPGAPPVVNLYNLSLKGDALKLRSFPFPFYDVVGNVSVIQDEKNLNDRKITIRHIKAKHSDDKNIELEGAGYYNTDGEWEISFGKLTIDDLDTGNRFRKALPDGVRAFFESTDPRGHNISAQGRLALAGFPVKREMIVTARWDIDIFHSGTTITAGVDLKDMFGRVNLVGAWDGEAMTGNGSIDLANVTVNGYQLTDVTGPFYIQGDQFIIGSREIASGQRPSDGPGAPDDQLRVTAKFIGGKLALDGIAKLDEKNHYFIKVQIRNGRVEQYAKFYAPRQKQLRGVLNGDVTFDGHGSNPDSFRGQGRLSINPAALYELPVVLAMTKTLSFLPPDKTAFDRAYTEFIVNNHEFHFTRIDLKGDAVSLRGRGRMRRSDSRLNLEFYSTVPRNQLPVPVVGSLLGQATEGWIEIQVTGTTENPRIKQSIIPRLDGSLRGFLGILTPPSGGRTPRNSSRNNNPPRR